MARTLLGELAMNLAARLAGWVGLGALAACAGRPAAAPSTPPVVATATRTQGAPMNPPDPFAARAARLRVIAEERDTDALVIVKDGEVVLRWQREGAAPRVETMSVTKSIAGLVIGALVDRGAIGLDDPLARYFPAWVADPRGAITVRHVLAHASGLADEPTTEKIYARGDFVAYALEAPLAHPPGTRAFYSNRASNLLAGGVRAATGRQLADVASEVLFARLGITDVVWRPDRAGNTQVMAGLELRAEDLAKLGQLVLDDGVWRGERILSHAWIEASTRTFAAPLVPTRGLLFWLEPAKVEVGFDRELFDEWARTGMPADVVERFRPLEGRFYERRAFFEAVGRAMSGGPVEGDLERALEPWYAVTWKAGRRDGSMRASGVASIRADGWLGQYLLVYPAERVVVARLRHAKPGATGKDPGSFGDLEKVVRRELFAR